VGCEAIAIHEAYQRGDLEALKALLGSREIDLEYAIYHSPMSFVRTLLELGADPNYEDHAGFPSLIATTPERLGEAHTANGVGLQIAAAVLGQSLLPALVGVLAHHLGLEIIGPALCTAAVVLLALYESLTALPLQGVHLVPCIRR